FNDSDMANPWVANWLGTLPGWGVGEGIMMSPVTSTPGVPNTVGATLGQVRRAYHQYNTSYSPFFDVQTSAANISQTGKFVVQSTDGLGQFGQLPTSSYPSGRASCNIGAEGWNANSTDFSVGSY